MYIVQFIVRVFLFFHRADLHAVCYIFEASAASPTLVMKTENCLFIYFIYIWYVRIPYIHPALFVRDATFHVMLLQII